MVIVGVYLADALLHLGDKVLSRREIAAVLVVLKMLMLLLFSHVELLLLLLSSGSGCHCGHHSLLLICVWRWGARHPIGGHELFGLLLLLRRIRIRRVVVVVAVVYGRGHVRVGKVSCSSGCRERRPHNVLVELRQIGHAIHYMCVCVSLSLLLFFFSLSVALIFLFLYFLREKSVSVSRLVSNGVSI